MAADLDWFNVLHAFIKGCESGDIESFPFEPFDGVSGAIEKHASDPERLTAPPSLVDATNETALP